MRISASKTVFSPEEVHTVQTSLKAAAERGILKRRKENNQYLLASYQGVDGSGISPKWNVKIYTYSDRNCGHSVVCVDTLVLQYLLDGDERLLVPPDRQVLSIDDAGWGFPLCGVMVGVSDQRQVKTAVVPIAYFRRAPFDMKTYLKVYSQLALGLVEQFGGSPGTHRVEICSGYLNQPLRSRLRGIGYDTRVVEIRGLLQEQLEGLFCQYVRDELGEDLYYDPKALEKSQIPRYYYRALSYGQRHCPDKLKTGWGSMAHIGER